MKREWLVLLLLPVLALPVVGCHVDADDDDDDDTKVKIDTEGDRKGVTIDKD